MRRATDYDYFRRFNVRRLPSWRFDRASRLVDRSKPPHPKRDDHAIRTIRKYLIAKRQLRARFELEEDFQHELAGRYTFLWAAEQIFVGGSEDRLRYKLEACLLAGMSNKEIAGRVDLEPRTIEAYEQLYYNVRDKLAYKDYIAGVVLAGSFMDGLPDRTAELTYKYFGYYGGPLVLDLVSDAFTDAIPPPHEPSQLSSWIDQQFRLRMRTSAMIGISSMNPTNYNIRTLLEGYNSLLGLQHREQSQSGDDNVINRAIEQFVAHHPMPRGDDADKFAARPGPEYGGGAVEPRVNELVAVHQGQTPPGLLVYNDKSWDNPINRRTIDAGSDK